MRLAWLVPDAPDSLESFRRFGRSLTHVSPTWLRLDAEARLEARWQPEVVALCQEYGVALVPLVVNEGFKAEVAGAILGDPTRRRRAVDELVRFADRPEVAGINLDFEGPFGRWRHAYSEFVRELADRLHGLGKEVSVDVVCQTRPPQPVETLQESSDPASAEWVAAWAEPYDYRALGEAVDQLILMGYDFHARVSEPGPVGPLWWLQRVLTYTLSVTDPSKVVLGLPFYGRRWISTGPMTEADWTPREPRSYEMPRATRDVGFEPAEGLSFAQATREMAQATRSGRHPEEASPWGAYRHADGRLVVVHYDDAESLATKLALVRRHGLAGCAFWRLGQEDPAIWERL